MNTEPLFDGHLHRRAEEFAFYAELAERSGNVVAAMAQYAEAAELEEQIALEVQGRLRVRGVLAISAVALWLRAERWDDAARAGCGFLAAPNMLTPDGRRQLQSLVDRAQRSVAMHTVDHDAANDA